MMKFFDNWPYALFVAVCSVVAPLLVMSLVATTVRPLVVVPGMGLVSGFFAAIIILKSKHLRWSATVGEMMSAIRAEGGADSGAISLSVPEIEFKNGRFTHKVSFRDFHFLNRPRITRMLMIDWLAGILGWSVTFLLLSEPGLALTVTLAGLLIVHVARIAWLIRQRNLTLTLHQSTVTIAVGVAAGAVFLALAYASSALDLIGWWPVYRNVSLTLVLLSCSLVYVDIAIASIIRNFPR
jgi:hypothetical protein